MALNAVRRASNSTGCQLGRCTGHRPGWATAGSTPSPSPPPWRADHRPATPPAADPAGKLRCYLARPPISARSAERTRPAAPRFGNTLYLQVRSRFCRSWHSHRPGPGVDLTAPSDDHSAGWNGTTASRVAPGSDGFDRYGRARASGTAVSATTGSGSAPNPATSAGAPGRASGRAECAGSRVGARSAFGPGRERRAQADFQ